MKSLKSLSITFFACVVCIQSKINQPFFENIEIDLSKPFESTDESQDQEFDLFQQKTVMYNLYYPDIKTSVNARVHGGFILFEDDIVLAREGELELKDSIPFNSAKSESSHLVAGYAVGTLDSQAYRWPNATIPFEIDDEISSKKNLILAAIEEWDNKTNLKFVPIEVNSRENYESTHEFRKARIRFVKHENQCSSYVGKRPTNKDDFGSYQPINLASGCHGPQILHEIGHAIGLYHEQSRPDRDSYISINEDQLLEGKISQFNSSSNATMLGEYDLESIMHYSNRNFLKPGGSRTFEVIAQGTTVTPDQVGTFTYISQKDIESVNKLYPNPPKTDHRIEKPRVTTVQTPIKVRGDHAAYLGIIEQNLPADHPKTLSKSQNLHCTVNRLANGRVANCKLEFTNSNGSATRRYKSAIALELNGSVKYLIYLRRD